jgi:spermidine synthase
MKAWELLGETRTPDGSDVRLMRQDEEYVIWVDGKTLMSSRRHGSEEALATLACRHLQSAAEPRVLVGGLGMGFTLRATLDVLPPAAIVSVVELLPAVVEWNRGPLRALAGDPLNDVRVRVEVADVGLTLRQSDPSRFDAILLDVDNGPTAFTAPGNFGLYDNAGVAAAHAALDTGGVLAVWSARDDRKFEQRLRYHGFAVQVARVRARLEKGGSRHAIFVGVKGASGPRSEPRH